MFGKKSDPKIASDPLDKLEMAEKNAMRLQILSKALANIKHTMTVLQVEMNGFESGEIKTLADLSPEKSYMRMTQNGKPVC